MPRNHVYRHTLAGQARLVNAGNPFQNNAIDRNTLTGGNLNTVPHLDLFHGQFEKLAVSLNTGSAGDLLEQLAECPVGARGGHRFQQVPQFGDEDDLGSDQRLS